MTSLKLKSSVLILDHIYDDNNIFGADIRKNEPLFLDSFRTQKYSCAVLNLKLLSEGQLEQLLSQAKYFNPHIQLILFEAQSFHSSLISFINKFKVFKILSDREEDSLYRSIVDAKSEYDLILQNEQLFDLIQEKNIKLRDLNVDLELRIQARQKSLEESKTKLIQANKYFATLIQCLVGVQKGQTLLEIEKSLITALAEPLRIKIVKIQFQNSGSAFETTSPSLFKNKLSLEDPFDAYIIYAKKNEETFSKEEQNFLKQISSAVSLALKRLNSETLMKELKQQWQITFDSIKEPVILVTETYDLLQWNQSFEKYFYSKDSKCYKIFFKRDSPCEGCQLSKKFQLPLVKTSSGEEAYFAVESEWIDAIDNKKVYLNIYRDLKEQKRVERQILESSKMGELGLIGSSIAHELNNPLAGLITFIQMLKQDIQPSIPALTSSLKEKKSDVSKIELFEDIQAMEEAALRCKDIVQNLLSFSRKSPEQSEQIFLRDIINKALRVLQVKTKSLGLEIKTAFKTDQDLILGQTNPLTQGFIHILQNSIESLEEKRKSVGHLTKHSQQNFNPQIEIHVSHVQDLVLLDIYDNGLGLSSEQQLKAFTPFFTTKNSEQHRGLGLTLSYQIIKDHSGNIDISQVSEGRVCVRMTFPRLVLNS